jgi:hypothetical protein
MAVFRRRTPPVAVPAAAPVPEVGPRELMLRVSAEAVILQDRADELLASIRSHVPLGETARPTGQLVRRFLALREQLPARCADPGDEAVRTALSTILDHHAELLTLAMDLSAYEWRSTRLREQVEAIGGLGLPAARLERLWAELARGVAGSDAVPV